MTATTALQRTYELLTRKYMDDQPGILEYLDAGVTFASNGVVYAGYVDDCAVGEYTEGTPVGGGGSSQLVPLSPYTFYANPISVKLDSVNALDWSNGTNITQWSGSAATALKRKIRNKFIEILKAGSITNSGTLPSGQARFRAESYDEQLLNENILAEVISPIESEGYAPEDIAIVMSVKTKNLFWSGRSHAMQDTQLGMVNGRLMFQNHPIIVVPGDDDNAKGATLFGDDTSGEEVAFVVGRRGFSLHLNGPNVVRMPTEWNIDGHYRLVMEIAAHLGIKDVGHLGKIINT